MEDLEKKISEVKGQNLDEELLEKDYEIYKTNKLARLYKVALRTAQSWLKQAGILIRKSTKEISIEKKPPKQELKKDYQTHRIKDIVKKYGVCGSTIYKWLHEYKIPLRGIALIKKRPSKKELAKKFKELKSTRKVAKYYNSSQYAVWVWSKLYNIPLQKSTKQIALEKKPSLVKLRKDVAEGKTLKEIAELYGVSVITAWKWKKEISENKNIK